MKPGHIAKLSSRTWSFVLSLQYVKIIYTPCHRRGTNTHRPGQTQLVLTVSARIAYHGSRHVNKILHLRAARQNWATANKFLALCALTLL